MSLFRKREPPASGPGAELPRAAVCFLSHAMTRRAADWLGNLGEIGRASCRERV